MSRRITLRAALAALAAALLVLAIPVAPAFAALPTVTVTINGHSGDHEFNLMFLPITGAAEPQYFDNIPTNGSNQATIHVSAGAYHVLVTSAAGDSGAGWFLGSQTHDSAASRAVVTTGGPNAFTFNLGTTPATFTGTTTSFNSGAFVYIAAYNKGLNWPADRYPLSSWIGPSGSAWSLEGLPQGTYDIVFQDFGSTPQTHATTVTGQSISTGQTIALGNWSLAALPGNEPSIERLSGADRYSTAVAIGQEAFSAAPDTVFIVNGENFPDALSAGPAATKKSAPILLVKPNSIPQVVKNQLDDWFPSTIYIIGGVGSVSQSVENQLEAYAGNVVRIAGSDRYATSLAVASQIFPGSSANTIYLANGSTFPDALGAGPAAGLRNGPVVLVKGALPHLDAATKTLIDGKPQTFPVQIAGGTGVITQGIDNDVAALVFDHRRRAGADRYSTAAEIVDGTFGQSNIVYLATGTNFPDALAGSAAAGSDRAPILLVRSNCIPGDAYAQLIRLSPNKIYLLGGTGVLSNALASWPLPSCESPGD